MIAMNEKAITLADVSRRHTKIVEAFTLLEREFPGFQVVLERMGSAPAEAAGCLEQPAPQRRAARAGSMRERVAEASRGKWLTIPQLAEAAGVTRRQIYGVITAKDGPKFERRNAPDGVDGVLVEVRLIEEAATE